MDSSANGISAMGGIAGDSSFLQDSSHQQQQTPQQQQQQSYGGQGGHQAPPQQQQQQLSPSVFTQYSPSVEQQQQAQGGMVYNNTQYRPQQQSQQQQQQAMMKSPPQYQQQQQQPQQQPSPYNFSPPPQPQPSQNSGGMGSFAQRSAMMQPQQGGAAYGNPQQQQQQQVQQQHHQPTPPVAQINVPIRQSQQQQQPQSNNMYGGGGRAPAAPASGSYAQRYQAMQQNQQPQNQQQQEQQPLLSVQTNSNQSNNSGSMYSPEARGSNNLYPPSAQQQQQPPPQAGAAAGGSFAQRQAAMMGQGGQPQIQQSQIQKQQQQQQAPASGSFAQRQAAMMGQGGQPQNLQQQQQFQQPGQPQQQQQQFQQPGQQPPVPPQGPPMPPQPPQLPIMVDPPEVIARQNHLLTEATRKVQEHAYYMKQAIDRHDLPVVLDRAASMVGELGEHAHSHNNHKLHPPAPGASGTSTALQPKNYYELHLRALEELPTLENYLLDLATASKQQQQQQQGQQQQQQQGQQQQQQQPPPPPQQQGFGGAPAPSSANSAALMQQLTGDPNATGGGGNFMNSPPQPPPNNMNPLNPNPNNPLGSGPSNYNNVMGGGNGSTLNNNPMMANTQNPQMGMGMGGMGMTNSGMMNMQQQQQQPLMNSSMTNSGMMNMQQQQQQQQPMMNSSSIVPPTPAITYTMMELYDCVQYCPNVLSRLYLQICAASALIRSGEVGARWVFKDLIEAVKCVQNPVRGLFLRHYLLQAFRDKLPDVGIPIDQIGSLIRGTASSARVPAAPTGENVNSLENVSSPAPKLSDSVADMSDPGTVKDSYEFVLANFIEMNKLWVRIQHLPGDQRTKAVRRRREKDRNELRILVGTNLVRLSALDSITSTIYGQVILPTVLDQIVICADPLSQAYLLDCIVQVFPDEYHIETMPILLAVCPKLRDKVNIRTVLGSLMTRLANYLADEELLDEKDSNQVKRAVALDSFRMFDECVQNVYNARGPKLNAKEVIRLQTALLEYSMKCYKGNVEQITLCLKNCVLALQQERDNVAYMMPPPQQQQHQQQYGQPQQPPPPPPTALEPVATKELEKLLSIPLEELALGVLTLDHYSDLIAFLPWSNRRELAVNMLESVIGSGKPPESVKEIEAFFSVIAPVLRGEHDELAPSSTFAEVDRTTNLMAGLGVSTGQQQHQSYAPQPQQGFNGGGIDPIRYQQDSVLVSKFIGMLDNADTDVLFEMLSIARKHMSVGQNAAQRSSFAHSALVFESLKLARRVFQEAHEEASPSPAVVVAEDEKADAENVSEEETEAVASSEEPETEAKVETVEEGEADVDTTEQAEEDTKPAAKEDDAPKEAPKKEKVITCRNVFVFILQTIGYLAQASPERGIKLYLEVALTADKLGAGSDSEDEKEAFGTIANELLTLSFSTYEEQAPKDVRIQRPCVTSMIGTLVACRSLGKSDYETLIMTVSKFAAKMTKQSEQCEMVTRCSHLFYVLENDGTTIVYANPQRSLECLQRSLKLANACTTADVSNLKLFVELFDIYLYFFEKNNPHITGNYITGLAALIKEHSTGIPPQYVAAAEAKQQFLQIVRYIKVMKAKPESTEKFREIDVSSVET